MAGRFPDTVYLDRCLNPVLVYHHGVKYQVPCGKCEACLLARSNKWTFRLEDEVKSRKYSIFFTLTYNNKYVPKVHLTYQNGVYWYDYDELNIRFNGAEDVLRDDPLPRSAYISHRSWPTIQNFGYADYFAYSSKRDIQLWLKLVRKDVFVNYFHEDKEKQKENPIRYYIISEYGPTTFRPHYHGLLFVDAPGLAEYLVRVALYQNWQMCDKTLFEQHTVFASPGVCNYLAAYLTQFGVLPSVLEFSEFKPFRLASKAPSIGYSCYDKDTVTQGVSVGDITYLRPVPDKDTSAIFRYPSDYLRRLFPKCYEYSLQSFAGLQRLYGAIYSSVVRKGQGLDDVCARLRQNLRPIDYYCAVNCYRFCVEFGATPDYYLYLLDEYDYASSMATLRYYYEWQQSLGACMEVFRSYINVGDYLSAYLRLSRYSQFVFREFCAGFGIVVDDFRSFSQYETLKRDDTKYELYQREVHDIVVNATKFKSFNERFGLAPHIV